MSAATLFEVPATPVELRLCDDSLLHDLSELRGRIAPLLRAGQGTVVIDVCGVDRVSSATIAALIWVKRNCLARHVDLTVRAAGGRGTEVLRRSGLAEVLEIHRRGVCA